jgi:hypothetical protein
MILQKYFFGYNEEIWPENTESTGSFIENNKLNRAVNIFYIEHMHTIMAKQLLVKKELPIFPGNETAISVA